MSDNAQDRRLASLMESTQSGDRAAYATLLREVDAILTPYFRRRLRCVDTTCDVIQDTLMSVHSARHTYDPEKPFLPWLFAIARCRLVDHWRKQERHAGSEPLDNVDTPDKSELSVGSSGSVASEALAELAQNDRDVIQLLKIEGLSLKEVAKKLQLTESAVKVRAHRAYQRLRNVFHRISNNER